MNFLDIFSKNNPIFRENPSSGSRVVLFGRRDRQTDMTELIVAFRNFANAPKNLTTATAIQHKQQNTLGYAKYAPSIPSPVSNVLHTDYPIGRIMHHHITT